MSKICSKELTPEQDIDIVKWVFRSGSGALSIENAVYNAYFNQNSKWKYQITVTARRSSLLRKSDDNSLLSSWKRLVEDNLFTQGRR